MRGIVMTPDGRTERVDFLGKTGDAIRERIGCRAFDVVGLDHELDMFVDDEGAINGSPLNLAATIVAHVLGTTAMIFGTVAIFGVDQRHGDTVSLTDLQIARVLRVMRSKPDTATIDRLCQSLALLPSVVALLRAVQ